MTTKDKQADVKEGEAVISRKLSKGQSKVVMMLAQEQETLERQLVESRNAMGEHLEGLRQQFGLPEGQVLVEKDKNGGLLLRVKVLPKAESEDAEDPAQEV